MLESPPITAVLTPAGRGAIATVAVRGSRAGEIVAGRFQAATSRPISRLEPGRIAFGRFRSAAAEEELIVARLGPQQWEIHCHGGSAAVEAIVAALVADGCGQVSWHEWAEQHETDLLSAEARIALADARTERTAAILLAQYQGALRQEIASIQAALEQSQLAAADSALRRLLQYSIFGQHLTQPWKVVLAGRPNVGKSSLINALVGYQRSIVFDQPGTTRDVVTATTAVDGWPLELSDTAGLHASGDAIEQAGIERTEQQLAKADLILLVFEAPEPWSAGDAALLASLPGQTPRIVVYNKSDLGQLPFDERPAGLLVSAASGAGLESLLQQISATLVPQPPASAGAAAPFTTRQVTALAAARDALTIGDAPAAAGHLASLRQSCAASA